MPSMASPVVVPVIDVQGNNFKELWPAMVLAIKTSSFISLDTELSGLGARKALLAESIEDRYKAICHAARTRSILSLGIACYKKLDKAETAYLVQVYNLTLLCTEEYIIEPQSVQFLVQHGFDFNKQYAEGVPYYKGNDKGGDAHGVNMRTLFVELLRARKPLVVHNGLIDMVFLYQCFYAHLPERLATFTADLSQMFPTGIYDTKYATEYDLRFTASYLEYAYKKCKLENARSVDAGGTGPHLVLEFCNYTGHMQSYVDYRPCSDTQSHPSARSVCIQFSAYGWCPNGSQCAMSHDTDLIILQDEKSKEEKKKKRKRKKKQKAAQGGGAEAPVEVGSESPKSKRAHIEEPTEPKEGVPGSRSPLPGGDTVEEQAEGGHEVQSLSTNTDVNAKNGSEPKSQDGAKVASPARESQDGAKVASPARESQDGAKVASPALEGGTANARDRKVEGGTHRAGFDAFMTGYIFAFACIRAGKPEDSTADAWIPECLNKLYLSGKSVPLHVAKSTFSKSSKAHVHKMDFVWGKGVCDSTTVRAEGTA